MVAYSDEIAALICERIANGQSLREICKAGDMPSKQSVLNWLADPERAAFLAQYARAREAQADHFAEEILEISDDASNDWMLRNHGDDDPVEVPNHEHISRSKLRVDSRKWLMSKLAPKKYGEKLDLEHSGQVQISRIEHVIVDPK